MTLLKKFLLPLLAITLLAGCAASNNTLNINPAIAQPQQDPGLMGITINISSQDQRTDTALAKIQRDGQLVSLYPSRDLRFLMQEVLEKQMTARGYMLGSSNGPQLQVVINQLFANVQEGNVRFNITTSADISIKVQAPNGSSHVKNYRATYNVQGAFSATNQKIADSVTSVLSDVIADMAKDTSVHEFIKQNAR